MRFLSRLSVVVLLVNSQPLFSASKADEIDLAGVCKEHCPDGKTNAQIHECVERKAKIRKSIKDTKCWEENEKYEKLIESTKKAK